MELIKVINNISERVVDDLKTKLSKGSRVSIAAAFFSIYAFEALKEELENVDELRFIFIGNWSRTARFGGGKKKVAEWEKEIIS